jgi:uncharacterized protein (TIGR02246 family)
MPAYQPADLHNLFRAAFNCGDVDALVALYEPDATLVVSGAPVTGADNIRTTLESWLSRKGQMQLETRVVIESRNGLAVLHGVWVISPQPGDQDSLARQGVSTEVVRRQRDGTWRFVIDSPHTPVTTQDSSKY